MSLLLPQNRAGTLHSITPVDIHGDRYVDVALALDGEPVTPASGRIGAGDCAAGLAAGDRVIARFVMGVLVRLSREGS